VPRFIAVANWFLRLRGYCVDMPTEATGDVPNAMISLRLHELGMQVSVAAGGSDPEARVMEVFFDDPNGAFRYAARVRLATKTGEHIVEVVTVSRKPGIGPRGQNPSLNRKVLAAVPLAHLLRGAREALGWDLQAWGNAIARFPSPPKGQSYPDEHYEQIAGAYRTAIAAGEPPRPFIAETWRVSGATVSRWIRTARELKVLEPAPRAYGGRPRR
jgi:hypothetical protein